MKTQRSRYDRLFAIEQCLYCLFFVTTCLLLCSNLRMAAAGVSMCVPAPLTIGPTCKTPNATCSTGNVTLEWPFPPESQSLSGWLPLKFDYNERQYFVTLRAVDSKGIIRTFVVPTTRALILDSGTTEGAILVAAGVGSQFYKWPITVLNQIVPPDTFNATCWSLSPPAP